MASPLVVEPIGFVRSAFVEPADAPRQPGAERAAEGRIELVAGRHLEDAVADLEGWSHIWVVFWFHRHPGYSPKVLPPRSDRKRGVLATRSPHRPNPIGLSVVELVAVESLVLRVRGLDMLDGTPVLDLKPYVAYADARPEATSGWLGGGDAALGASGGSDGDAALAPGARERLALPRDPRPRWEVAWSEAARAELAFVAGFGLELAAEVERRLALGPQPHAYRRIRVEGDRGRLAYKAWRFDFRIGPRRIEIVALTSGYRPRELALSTDPALEVHRAFAARFGGGRG